MTDTDQLDGPFDEILATAPDLDAIAVELADLTASRWVHAGGTAQMDVLLRAAAAVRNTAPLLLERVRRLEQIADGRIVHVYRGRCPDPINGPDARDGECRACEILGAPTP
ncbi:hypothetical protein HQQ80_18955 [Microbacteriaceae bacterium VKM Ac-2855]|nr:hypothetical protein [Microbacteriaceae bacterium VKM Ac-2855]